MANGILEAAAEGMLYAQPDDMGCISFHDMRTLSARDRNLILEHTKWLRDRKEDMSVITKILADRDQVVRYIGYPKVRESDGANVFYINTGRVTDPATGKYGLAGGEYSMDEILENRHIEDALKEAIYEW